MFGFFKRQRHRDWLLERGVRALDDIAHTLREIRNMVSPETRKVIDALKAATDKIAARLDKLKAHADLTPEEQAEFDSLIARANSLGADPDNPVPPEPPAPPLP